MKHKSTMLIALALIFVLFSGCTPSLVKFNAKNAQSVKDQSIIIMDTVQDYLTVWPMYSGWIRRALDPIKDQLPQEFWDAMDSLDDLAQYCPGMTEPPPPPGGKCDFSEWEPEVISLESNVKISVLTGTIKTELGPRLVYEGVKRTEYGTGWAAGDATIMASVIVMEVLEQFSNIAEIAHILKIIPVLAL